MPYRFVEHTADAGVEVSAANLPELFDQALRGMTDVVTDVEQVQAVVGLPVEVAADQLDALLLEFLTDALFRFEADQQLFCGARVEIHESARGWSLEGVLAGEALAPDRHPMKVMIKAVTYHQLEVVRTPDGWRARVIFDI